MELKNKLILEDLEDEVVEPVEIVQPEVIVEPEVAGPELTPAEEHNFNMGTISDILNKDLELYNYIKSVTSDQTLKPELQLVLGSVADDLAISIGKLQECLKISADDHIEELINHGEEQVQEIVEEEPVKEE